MPDEKRYKLINDFKAFFYGDKIFTADEIIDILTKEKFIKEVKTEKQYWLGSRRMFKCGDVWKHITDEIIIQDELFQLLVREGIITEREVEVGD